MNLVDLRPVFRVVGLLLCGLALAMLVPAAVDYAARNRDWQAFVEAAASTGFVGLLFVIGTGSSKAFALGLRQAFVLTVCSWLFMTAFAALPLLGLGLDYTDAFFEAISGVTTTGSTVLVGLDALPPGILLWRALLQWVGGIGIIVMAIVVLPFLRVGGMQLFRTESSEQSEKVVPSAFQMAAWITAIYAALTIACALIYGLSGMSVFDAVCHALTTLSTGGYSTHDSSFVYFRNPLTHWAGTFFMLAGALPFVAYIRFVRGRTKALWQDTQIRTLIAFLAGSSVVMALWLAVAADMPLGDALRLSAFNITSVVTTTGFANADYGQWGPLAASAFLVFTFVGGCTGSTSGGIKIFRFQVVWLTIRSSLLRLASPHRVVVMRYGSRILSSDIPASVLAFVAVFMATVAVFTIVLTGMGLDLMTALSASATAIANVGPGLGPIIGPAGNFAVLPDAAKWILAAAMLLGRLEIFTVLVLLDPQFWRY